MNLLKESKNRTSGIRRKLRSRVGESIAETLVALLIAALALTMLAGAVSASSNIVTKSRTTLNNYYNAMDSTVVKMADGGKTGKQIELVESESGWINGPIESGSIVYYVNETFARSPVIAYKKAAGTQTP